MYILSGIIKYFYYNYIIDGKNPKIARNRNMNSFFCFRFVILACDGLWKTFSNEQALTFAIESQKSTATQSMDSSYETCCDRLAVEAIKRLSADNVTVIIIAIDQVTP